MEDNNQLLVTGRNVGLITYATLAAVGVAAVFLTNWPAYYYEIRGGPAPVYYFLAAGLMVVPILFAEPASALRFAKVPLFWWFVAYVVAGLIWILPAQDFIEEASRLWRLRFLEFLFFCTVIVLCLHAKRPLLALAIIACVFLASACNWFDVMRPYRFVPEGVEGSNPGRGSGFFMNANSAAEIVILGTIVALPFVTMRLRALVLIAMVVGVAPTLSRAGLLISVVIIVAAIVLKMLSRTQALLALIAVPLLVVAKSVYTDRIIDAADSPLGRTITRLDWFDSGDEDDSVEARKWAASRARDMFLDQPVFGHGIGATTQGGVSDGPHNMYVMLMAEQGLFGLALYVSLIGVLFSTGRRLSRIGATEQAQQIGKAMILYSAFLMINGLFSHNILEEAYGMFLLAFLSAAAMQSERYGALQSRAPRTPVVPARLRWRASIPKFGRREDPTQVPVTPDSREPT